MKNIKSNNDSKMKTEEYVEQLKLCKTKKEFKELWNPDKFDWYYSYLLCKHCTKFIEIWFDSEKFDWDDLYALCDYCDSYISIWWSSKKFNWDDSYIKFLYKYCSEYKYIWEKDYIKWKLKNT